MNRVETKHLSDRVLQMEESATIRMAQLARDLSADGHDIISLSLGEPDFDTPEHIKAAAVKALADGHTKYTPVPGLVSLRKAIVEKFQRDNGLEFNIDQIVVSNGAKQSIANVSLALLNEGDEAIILTPYWVSYYEIIHLAGGIPILVKAGVESDFKPTADQIEEAITPKTKFILYSSPCNPTGSVFQRKELLAIARMLEKYPDVYVISDEIYEYINFTGKHESIGTLPGMRERTITVNGFSKGFAMTGWRLGYMGAPKEIAQACAKIQGQFTSGASSFGQVAAAHALEADLQPTLEMREAFRKRRDLVIDHLNDLPGFKVNNPEGAFYVFPDISALFGTRFGEIDLHNADDFSAYLLHEAHVATVSGKAFGDEDCIRLSYAASEEQLEEAMRRIKTAVNKLS